jgi:hypothetical protein
MPSTGSTKSTHVLLRERDSSFGFDGLHAARAVGGRAREDDADGSLAAVLGERLEEGVDRQVGRWPRRSRREVEDAARDGHLRAGRDHVDAIDLHHHPLVHRRDLQRRDPREQLDEVAGVRRVEVLHDDDRETRLVADVPKELRDRAEATGGRTDRDNGKGRFRHFLRVVRRAAGGFGSHARP